jgi:hypothetical protein
MHIDAKLAKARIKHQTHWTCVQHQYQTPPQYTMPRPNSPTKKSIKLQSVHTFKCTQRKQRNWNPCASMHCALCTQESNELCTMSMLSSEHVCNVEVEFTHNAQQQCQVLQHFFCKATKCALMHLSK